MAIDISLVKLHGFAFPDFQLTFNLEDGVAATDKSGPMTLDPATANTVKKPADGDFIAGILLSYEDREIEGIKVGTVALKFASKLPVKASNALAAGDYAVCAGSGEVRKWVDGTDDPIPSWAGHMVTEVTGGYATIVKL